MRVLLIDDEESWLSCFEETIHSLDSRLQIFTTTAPKMALEAVKQNFFDLIFVDFTMPNITGDLLTSELKALSPNSKVVIVSANSQVSFAVKCLKLGADDYLDKGDDYDAFIERLELCLLSAKMQQHYDAQANDKHFQLHQRLAMKHADSTFSHLIDTAITRFEVNNVLLLCGEEGSGKTHFLHSLCALHREAHKPEYYFDLSQANGLSQLYDCLQNEAGLKSALIAIDNAHQLGVALQTKLLALLEAQLELRVVGAYRCEQNYEVKGHLFTQLRTNLLKLPNLHERLDDVELIAQSMLASLCAQMALKPLLWPQNALAHVSALQRTISLHDLQNAIRDGILLSQSETLSIAPLLALQGVNETATLTTRSVYFPDKLPTLKEIEQLTINEAMRRAGGKQSLASKLLGISQSALSRRLNP